VGNVEGKILIIEDEPNVAGILRQVLTDREGIQFDVELAYSLESGIELAQKVKVDAVILDLNLSDSEGPETFRKFHLEFPKIPIVVLTGLGDESLAIQLVQEGAVDYLVKGRLEILNIAKILKYAIQR